MSTEQHDQEVFDREVARKGKLTIEVLAGVGIFAAVIMSMIAMIKSFEDSSAAATAAPAAVVSGAATPASSSSGGATMTMANGEKMSAASMAAAAGGPAALAAATHQAEAVPIMSGAVQVEVIAEGKKGPEGTLHDDFTVTNYHVKVGEPVTLRIDNTDTVTHSITAPEAGVSINAAPGTHGYTLLVKKAGDFEWHCSWPCDPWSMEHLGYMRGVIVATPS